MYAIQKLYCCSGDHGIIAGLDYFLNNWSIIFAFTIYLTKVRTFLQRKWDCSFALTWISDGHRAFLKWLVPVGDSSQPPRA